MVLAARNFANVSDQVAEFVINNLKYCARLSQAGDVFQQAGLLSYHFNIINKRTQGNTFIK